MWDDTKDFIGHSTDIDGIYENIDECGSNKKLDYIWWNNYYYA